VKREKRKGRGSRLQAGDAAHHHRRRSRRPRARLPLFSEQPWAELSLNLVSAGRRKKGKAKKDQRGKGDPSPALCRRRSSHPRRRDADCGPASTPPPPLCGQCRAKGGGGEEGNGLGFHAEISGPPILISREGRLTVHLDGRPGAAGAPRANLSPGGCLRWVGMAARWSTAGPLAPTL
jgi:hypothetical protein